MTKVTGLEPLLAGEHAAVDGYAIAGAVLVRAQAPVELLALSRGGFDAHRRSRDELTDAIVAGGGDPPPALAAYALPFAVAHATSAVRFMVLLEDRLCDVAVSCVGAATGPDRELAANVLSAAAVRAVKVRLLAGVPPRQAAPALPGWHQAG